MCHQGFQWSCALHQSLISIISFQGVILSWGPMVELTLIPGVRWTCREGVRCPTLWRHFTIWKEDCQQGGRHLSFWGWDSLEAALYPHATHHLVIGSCCKRGAQTECGKGKGESIFWKSVSLLYLHHPCQYWLWTKSRASLLTFSRPWSFL